MYQVVVGFRETAVSAEAFVWKGICVCLGGYLNVRDR